MKNLQKVSLAIVLVFFVSACGDKKGEVTLQNAATVQAQAAVAEKVSLADQLPKLDQKLLEPINISDQKSATAIDDFNKLIAFNQKYHAKVTSLKDNLKAKSEFESKNNQGKEHLNSEFYQAYNESIAFANEYIEESKKLDIQDTEVKALAERLIGMTVFGLRAGGDIIKLSVESEKESLEVQQEFGEKMKLLNAEIDKSNQISLDALNAFLKKYQ